MCIHAFAAGIMFSTMDPKCGMQKWLGVMFALMFLDRVTREFFSRMKNNVYWD